MNFDDSRSAQARRAAQSRGHAWLLTNAELARYRAREQRDEAAALREYGLRLSYDAVRRPAGMLMR